MLRTLVVLEPTTRQDGTRCLKGQLSRDFIATDHKGGTRHYPRGTAVVLVKNPKGGSYSLLAQLPDEVPEDFGAEIAEFHADPFPPSPF